MTTKNPAASTSRDRRGLPFFPEEWDLFVHAARIAGEPTATWLRETGITEAMALINQQGSREAREAIRAYNRKIDGTKG